MKIIAWPAFQNRVYNPYNYLLYSHLEKAGVSVEEFSPISLLFKRYDIFHIHWPELVLVHPDPIRSLIKTYVFLSLIQWVKFRGARVVWTVHNLQAHETSLHPTLNKILWPNFLRLVDACISLSYAGKAQIQEAFPSLKNRPIFVVPHGHYRDTYPNQVSQSEARTQLGIPIHAQVITSFGQVRPYKNLPRLIEKFRELEGENLVLVIAGRSRLAKVEEDELKAIADDPRIKLFLKFIPDEDVQLYLTAADLVVLPYLEILNSGSALLALSFNRPILVPNRGAMSELQQQVGSAWVSTYTGELTATILKETLDWTYNESRSEQAPLEDLSWSTLSEKTLTVYQAIRQAELSQLKEAQ